MPKGQEKGPGHDQEEESSEGKKGPVKGNSCLTGPLERAIEGAYIHEGALLWSVVALCRHKLALAGYEFCILTLEEKIAKQKDLPEDVLPGGTALSAKGFSPLAFLHFPVLDVAFVLPKHHLHVNPNCVSFLL